MRPLCARRRSLVAAAVATLLSACAVYTSPEESEGRTPSDIEVGAGKGGTSTPSSAGGTSVGGTTGEAGAARGGQSGGGHPEYVPPMNDDGGAAGAATSDPTCTLDGNELCEGFESGAIDPSIWTILPPSAGASLEVDALRPHRGSYSLHIRATAGAKNSALLQESATFPARDNAFYTRVFVYFSPALPMGPDANYQTAFVKALGKNDYGNVQAALGMIGGNSQFVGYTVFQGPPFWQFGPWSKTRVTPGTWMCLELYENGSSTSTEIRKAWLNDNELTELSTDSAKVAGADHPNHHSPAFAQLAIGLDQFVATPSLTDVWLDDVRVSSERIGCDD